MSRDAQLQLRCLEMLVLARGSVAFAARRLHWPQAYVRAMVRAIECDHAVQLMPPWLGPQDPLPVPEIVAAIGLVKSPSRR